MSRILDDAKVQQISDEIHAQVDAAHAAADAAPFPPKEDIWKDVYSDPFPPYLKRN